MPALAYAHIELRSDGVPVIAGTRMKVAQVARDRIEHGLDAEEIRRQYPDLNLSLGQIYSALAYYFDHRDELDRGASATDRLIEEMKAEQGESPGRAKLRARGLIP